jgi:hypothetical protein
MKYFHIIMKKIQFLGYRGELDEKIFIFFSLPLFKQVLIGSDSSLKSPTKYLETKTRSPEIGGPWIGILISLYLSL